MSCGVGHGRGSDPALLWLWHRPLATAPIRPLAWKAPYATGAALKKAKRQKKKKKKRNNFSYFPQGKKGNEFFYIWTHLTFVFMYIYSYNLF